MNEEIIEHISTVVKELGYDIRMEVIAAYMIQMGLNPDDLLFTPLGLFKRTFSKDIENISKLEVSTRNEYAQVAVNREGIYNSIPEAMTHGGRNKKKGSSKTIKDKINEVKARKQEEKWARLFFQPFESEFYQQLVNLEIEEQNILKGYTSDSPYTKLLNTFWDLPEILDARQKATFIYLIPIIHKIVGDFYQTALCYEIMLGTKVDFTLRYEFEHKLKNTLDLSSDKIELGVNFVCGEKFNTNKQFLEIAIGPFVNGEMNDYLPEGKGRAVIEFLNSYFLSFEIDYHLKIISDSKKENFILAEQNSDLRLGYSINI